MEERRIVTVLFADVTGSTALAEDLDPEELRALLARYYTVGREVVEAHGGVLEKFIGDAVMAVFGLERAYGDDAERAVAAAVQLRARARADAELADLGLRFGLATGEVAASRGAGAADFLVTGDAVNTAARLQQAARPWQILAAARTARAVRHFDFGEPVEVPARGRRNPVTAREVLGKVRRGAAAGRVPLIGRDDELDQLRLTARRVFRDRRPAVVTIVGAAGVGKSRLVEEFVATVLPEVAPEARVVATQLLPYGERVTFQPLRQVVLSLHGLTEESGPDRVRAALQPYLPEGGGPADPGAVFEAWRTGLQQAALERPLVMVVEDLHWASDWVLDLLEYALQPRGEAPLVAIALTRPELLERRPAWAAGSRNQLTLHLEPLGRQAVVRLARHILGGEGPERAELVAARAAGNPFYATELASALELGADEEMPDTVLSAVQARLDALPAVERRALQVGAVFGRSFRPVELAGADPSLEERVEGLCEQLVERDLLRRGEGERYSFRHILIRDVAYQGLPRAERARLHAAAADWIAAHIAGRENAQAEIVALHYQEAVSLAGSGRLPAGLDLERLRDRALEWLERAARVFMTGAAMREAGRHLRAAIEIAPPARQAHFYELLGRAETIQDSSLGWFKRALELTREHGGDADAELRAIVGLLFSEMRWTVSGTIEPNALEDLRARAAALAATTADERLLAAFLAADAFYPGYIDRLGRRRPAPEELAEADEKARRAVQIAERIHAHNLWSGAVDALGVSAWARREWEGVRHHALQRVDAGEWLPALERLDAATVAGWMGILLGELTDAERVTAAALRAAEGRRPVPPVLFLYTNQINVCCLLGRWEEVLRHGEETVRVWRALGAPTSITGRALAMALTVARGRQDEARVRLFHDAVTTVIASPHAQYLAAYLEDDPEELEREILEAVPLGVEGATFVEHALGSLLDQGHVPAKGTLDRLLEMVGDWRLPILEPQVLRGLGRRTGDAAALARAELLWTGFGARLHAARAAAEGAWLAGDADRLGAALAVVEEAGDRLYAARLQEAADG